MSSKSRSSNPLLEEKNRRFTLEREKEELSTRYAESHSENVQLNQLVNVREEELRKVIIALIQRDAHVNKQDETISALHCKINYIQSAVNMKEMKQALVEAASVVRKINEERLALLERSKYLVETNEEIKSRNNALEAALDNLKEAKGGPVLEYQNRIIALELSMRSVKETKDTFAGPNSTLPCESNDNKSNISDILQAHKESTAQLTMEHKDHSSKLSKALADADKTIATNKTEISALNSSLASEKDINFRIGGDLKKKDEEVKKMTQLLATSQKKENNSKLLADSFGQKIEELEKSLQSFEYQSSTKEIEHKKQISLTASLKWKLAASQSSKNEAVQQATEKIQEITELLAESESKRLELIASLEATAEELSSFDGEIFVKRRSSLKSILAAHKANISSNISKELSPSSQDNSSETVESLTGKLLSAEARFTELLRLSNVKDEKLKALSSTITSLKGEIEEATASLLEKTNDLDEAQSEIKELNAFVLSQTPNNGDVSRFKLSVATLESQISFQKSELDSQMELSSVQEAKIEELENALLQSKNQLTIKERELDALSMSLVHLKEEAKASAKEMEETTLVLLACQSKEAELKTEISRRISKEAHDRAVITILEMELDALKIESSSQRERSSHSEASLQLAQNEVRTISATMAPLKDKLKATEASLTEKSLEVSLTRKEIKELTPLYLSSQANEIKLIAQVSKLEQELLTKNNSELKSQKKQSKKEQSSSTKDALGDGAIVEALLQGNKNQSPLKTSSKTSPIRPSSIKSSLPALSNSTSLELAAEGSSSQRRIHSSNNAEVVESLEKRLRTSQLRIEELEKSQLAAKIPLKSTELEEAQIEIKELTSLLIASQTAEAQLKASIAKLEQDQLATKSDLASHVVWHTPNKIELDKSLLQSNTSGLGSKDIEINHLSSIIESLRENISKNEPELNGSLLSEKNAKDKLDTPTQYYMQELETVKKELSEKMLEVELAEREIKEITPLLMTSQASEAELKGSLAKLKKELGTSENELKLQMSKVEVLEKAISTANSKLIMKEKELSDNSSSITSLKEKLVTAQNALKENAVDVVQARIEIQEMTPLLIASQVSESNLKASIAKLGKDLEALNVSKESLQKAVTTSKENIDSLSSQVISLQAEKTSLQDDNSLLIKAMDDFKVKTMAAVGGLQDKIKTLELENRSLKSA